MTQLKERYFSFFKFPSREAARLWLVPSREAARLWLSGRVAALSLPTVPEDIRVPDITKHRMLFQS